MLVKDIKTEIRILTRCSQCNDILRSGERDEQTDARFVLYLEPCEKCAGVIWDKGREAAVASMSTFAKKDAHEAKRQAVKRKELADVEAEGPDHEVPK